MRNAMALTAAIVLLAACTPQEGEERYRRMRSDYDQTTSRDVASLAEVVVDSARSDDVLAMVKGYQSPDPNVDTDAWLTRKLYEEPGQVMFPRWEVRKRGASKYEARFTYTHIGADNRMVKRGMAWNVDTVLKVVSPPREINTEEYAGRVQRNESEDAQRRIRAAEASLE